MGDFDKQAAGSDAPKQGSKVALLGVLGAVLLGVVIFHFAKGSPQTAGAAVVSGGAAALPEAGELPTETPEQAQAALRNDPTAKLLRGAGDGDGALAQVPANPFVLDDKWRSQLVKAPDPAIANPEPLRPVAPVMPVAPAVQTVSADGFKLGGIFRENQRMVAIINGNIVSAGMVVGNAKVVEIKDSKVLLRHVNAPNGPTVELMLSPKN
jgi:hypothetical protein